MTKPIKQITYRSPRSLVSKSWFGLMFAAVVAAALILSASNAFANDSCIFRMFPPIMALPFSVDPARGAGQGVLRGVELYLPVDNMPTQEELITGLQRELMHTDGCGPRVESIDVSTLPYGAGFWVRLLGRDEVQAHELLTWAVGLVRPASARPSPMTLVAPVASGAINAPPATMSSMPPLTSCTAAGARVRPQLTKASRFATDEDAIKSPCVRIEPDSTARDIGARRSPQDRRFRRRSA